MHEEFVKPEEGDHEVKLNLLEQADVESFFDDVAVELHSMRDDYFAFIRNGNKSALRRSRSNARTLVKLLQEFLRQTKPSNLPPKEK